MNIQQMNQIQKRKEVIFYGSSSFDKYRFNKLMQNYKMKRNYKMKDLNQMNKKELLWILRQ